MVLASSAGLLALAFSQVVVEGVVELNLWAYVETPDASKLFYDRPEFIEEAGGALEWMTADGAKLVFAPESARNFNTAIPMKDGNYVTCNIYSQASPTQDPLPAYMTCGAHARLRTGQLQTYDLMPEPALMVMRKGAPPFRRAGPFHRWTQAQLDLLDKIVIFASESHEYRLCRKWNGAQPLIDIAKLAIQFMNAAPDMSGVSQKEREKAERMEGNLGLLADRYTEFQYSQQEEGSEWANSVLNGYNKKSRDYPEPGKMCLRIDMTPRYKFFNLTFSIHSLAVGAFTEDIDRYLKKRRTNRSKPKIYGPIRMSLRQAFKVKLNKDRMGKSEGGDSENVPPKLLHVTDLPVRRQLQCPPRKEKTLSEFLRYFLNETRWEKFKYRVRDSWHQVFAKRKSSSPSSSSRKRRRKLKRRAKAALLTKKPPCM